MNFHFSGPVRAYKNMNRWRLLLGALVILLCFVALNHGAYDGFFQDDELDNLSWAPYVGLPSYLSGLASPLFSLDNFRPTGHAYFGLMGTLFGLNFPPYMTPVFAIHLLNGLLLYLLLRRLKIADWTALGAAAFFLLSASAFDAYWKPMYVFDLLCATFCLLALLLYSLRWYVPSFVAFWLAYKSKELAVMLPAVLVLYEYWLGERRFLKLVPFLLVSLSFGLQGILRNPNHHNDYSFHFSTGALKVTVPFYTRRFLFAPLSGLFLLALACIPDRRIWLGLAAMILVSLPLLFLPGRLYEAYTYLPLACASIALAAAATHVKPQWALIALLVWLPWNVRQQRREVRAKLALDDEAYPFVDQVLRWPRRHPDVKTFVYTGSPSGYHHWGVTAAWNLAHQKTGLKALYLDTPEAQDALRRETVAFGSWDGARHELTITARNPSTP